MGESGTQGICWGPCGVPDPMIVSGYREREVLGGIYGTVFNRELMLWLLLTEQGPPGASGEPGARGLPGKRVSDVPRPEGLMSTLSSAMQ